MHIFVQIEKTGTSGCFSHHELILVRGFMVCLGRVRQRELIDNHFFPLSAVVCPAWLRARCARFTKLGRQQLIEEKNGCLLILSTLPSLVIAIFSKPFSSFMEMFFIFVFVKDL